jgi:hypothetical protein
MVLQHRPDDNSGQQALTGLKALALVGTIPRSEEGKRLFSKLPRQLSNKQAIPFSILYFDNKSNIEQQTLGSGRRTDIYVLNGPLTDLICGRCFPGKSAVGLVR